jgi:hypothetical protein
MISFERPKKVTPHYKLIVLELYLQSNLVVTYMISHSVAYLIR